MHLDCVRYKFGMQWMQAIWNHRLQTKMLAVCVDGKDRPMLLCQVVSMTSNCVGAITEGGTSWNR